jgi:hypothetical protein
MSETVETPILDLVVEEMNLGKLTTNAEALRDMVKGKLAGYSVENYSGDRIKEVKADKAELNAFAKRLNDKRLEFERVWMKPFEPFKAVVDETVKLIKAASSKIDEVVKDVEQGERDEKRRLIDQYWESQSCTLFRLDQIFDERWLNKTTKLSAVQDEIHERIKKAESDLGILDKIGEPEAKAYYLNCLDLNRAMVEADRIKANRERLAKVEQDRKDEERRAQEEAGRLAAESRAEPVLSPLPVGVLILSQTEPEGEPLPPIESHPIDEMQSAGPTAPEPPKLYDLTLRFTATMDELTALRAYVDEHGLKYEKIA